jgi:purine catabolism regulator
MLPAPGARPFGPEDVTVLERTAMSLTIARLVHSTTWERGAHRGALRDIAGQRHRSAGEARARAAALGLPTEDCRYLAVLVDTRGEADGEAVEALLAGELTAAGIPALTGELSPGRVAGLLALRPDRVPWRAAVERLARAALHARPHAVVSVGCEVTELTEAARSFHEATRVADAMLPAPATAATAGIQRVTPDKSFHELSDIGLRQLLYALREDTRIQDYAERTLGRIADHDSRHRTDLLTTLRHYLDAAGNKTVAARRGELSRQTLYQRLHSVERLLGCDLESGERRSELHVALMAYDVLRLP